MKFLNSKIVHIYGSEYLDFEVNKKEKAFLTSSRLISIAKQIAPLANLKYGVPPVLGYNPDINGNCKIQINVAKPYNELFIKEILTQYIKASLLTLEEANNIFQSACQILNTEFKSINPDESTIKESDQAHYSNMAMSRSLLEGIIKTSSKDNPPQNEPQVKRGNHDDFGSGLRGLKGVFK